MGRPPGASDARSLPVVAGVPVGRALPDHLRWAFSTANPGTARPRGTVPLAMLPDERVGAVFEATVQASEEAIVNARDDAGRDGHWAMALPGEHLRAHLRGGSPATWEVNAPQILRPRRPSEERWAEARGADGAERPADGRIGMAGSRGLAAGGFAVIALGTILAGWAPSSAEALCMAYRHRMFHSPLYYKAMRLLSQGRHEEAARTFRQAARTPWQAKSWEARVWQSAGSRARRAGRHLEAAEHFQRVLRVQPSNRLAARWMLQAFVHSGRLQEGLTALGRLPTGTRGDRGVLLEEARLRARAGDAVNLARVLARLRARGWLRPGYLASLQAERRGPLFQAPGALDF